MKDAKSHTQFNIRPLIGSPEEYEEKIKQDNEEQNSRNIYNTRNSINETRAPKKVNINNQTSNNPEEIKMKENSIKSGKKMSREEFDLLTGADNERANAFFEKKIRSGDFSIYKIIRRSMDADKGFGIKPILTPVEDLFQEVVKRDIASRYKQKDIYLERGTFLPNSLFNNRAILTSSNSSGLVPSIIRPDLIEPLHPTRITDLFTQVQTNGANLWTGDSSTLPGPVWYIEGEAASTPDEAAFVSLNSTPKNIVATISKSRAFFLSQSESTINLLMNDVLDAVDTLIGAAALYGTGTSGEPSGLNINSDLQTISGASFSFTTATNMEKTSENNNAKSNRVYIMHPNTKNTLKTREKVASTGKHIITPDNKMNGYPVISTTSCEATDIWFGDFSSILMVIYGKAFEMEVNKFGVGSVITIVFYVYRDILIRNGASFVKAENFS